MYQITGNPTFASIMHKPFHVTSYASVGSFRCPPCNRSRRSRIKADAIPFEMPRSIHHLCLLTLLPSAAALTPLTRRSLFARTMAGTSLVIATNDASVASAAAIGETVTGEAGSWSDVSISKSTETDVIPIARGSQINVDYTLRTKSFDGPVFESSEDEDRKIPLRFTVGTGAVTPAMDEAVATMKRGGVRRVVIPASAAVGHPQPA